MCIRSTPNKSVAEARGLIVDHSDKYGWSHTSPGDSLLQFCLDNDLTVMLVFAEYERGMIVERTQTGRLLPDRIPMIERGG